jgi:integral membrane protein (TIGR01906 family)
MGYKLRIFSIVAKWLFILCLPVLLLTASIGGAVNSLRLYEHGFEKNNARQTTGLAQSELEKVASGLITYFNSDEEYISLTVVKDGEPFELFTTEEIIHFRDVKGLIWLDYWLLLGTLIYVLGYIGICLLWRKRKYWRQLEWGVVSGSSITLALMLALGVGILLGFDQLFLQFHLISFTNELWSAEGDMLLLFRKPFFYDAAMFCALTTAGIAVILGGVAGGYLRANRRRTASR